MNLFEVYVSFYQVALVVVVAVVVLEVRGQLKWIWFTLIFFCVDSLFAFVLYLFLFSFSFCFLKVNNQKVSNNY